MCFQELIAIGTKDMLKIDLIWMKQCPLCNEEHFRTETAMIKDLNTINAANDIFEKQCEAWFESHTESFTLAQALAGT